MVLEGGGEEVGAVVVIGERGCGDGVGRRGGCVDWWKGWGDSVGRRGVALIGGRGGGWC